MAGAAPDIGVRIKASGSDEIREQFNLIRRDAEDAFSTMDRAASSASGSISTTIGRSADTVSSLSSTVSGVFDTLRGAADTVANAFAFAFNKVRESSGELALGAGLASAGVAGLVAATRSYSQSVADTVSASSELADQLSLPIEQFTRMQAAFRIEGGDDSKVGAGLLGLKSKIVQLAEGTQSAVDAFDNIGLKMKDFRDGKGNLLGTRDALDKVLDKIQGIRNPTTQAKAVLDVFGQSVSSLGGLATTGAAGLKEAEQEVAKFGTTVDEETKGTFEDALAGQAKLVESLRGLGLSLAKVFFPFFSASAEGLSTWLNDNREKIEGWLESLRDVATKVKEGVVSVVEGIFGVESGGRRYGNRAGDEDEDEDEDEAEDGVARSRFEPRRRPIDPDAPAARSMFDTEPKPVDPDAPAARSLGDTDPEPVDEDAASGSIYDAYERRRKPGSGRKKLKLDLPEAPDVDELARQAGEARDNLTRMLGEQVEGAKEGVTRIIGKTREIASGGAFKLPVRQASAEEGEDEANARFAEVNGRRVRLASRGGNPGLRSTGQRIRAVVDGIRESVVGLYRGLTSRAFSDFVGVLAAIGRTASEAGQAIAGFGRYLLSGVATITGRLPTLTGTVDAIGAAFRSFRVGLASRFETPWVENLRRAVDNVLLAFRSLAPYVGAATSSLGDVLTAVTGKLVGFTGALVALPDRIAGFGRSVAGFIRGLGAEAAGALGAGRAVREGFDRGMRAGASGAPPARLLAAGFGRDLKANVSEELRETRGILDTFLDVGAGIFRALAGFWLENSRIITLALGVASVMFNSTVLNWLAWGSLLANVFLSLREPIIQYIEEVDQGQGKIKDASLQIQGEGAKIEKASIGPVLGAIPLVGARLFGTNWRFFQAQLGVALGQLSAFGGRVARIMHEVGQRLGLVSAGSSTLAGAGILAGVTAILEMTGVLSLLRGIALLAAGAMAILTYGIIATTVAIKFAVEMFFFATRAVVLFYGVASVVAVAFRTVFTAAFVAVRGAAVAFWAFMAAAPFLMVVGWGLVIAAIAVGVVLIFRHFGSIKEVWAALCRGCARAWSTTVDAIGATGAFLAEIWREGFFATMGNLFEVLWEGFLNLGIAAWNKLKRATGLGRLLGETAYYGSQEDAQATYNRELRERGLVDDEGNPIGRIKPGPGEPAAPKRRAVDDPFKGQDDNDVVTGADGQLRLKREELARLRAEEERRYQAELKTFREGQAQARAAARGRQREIDAQAKREADAAAGTGAAEADGGLLAEVKKRFASGGEGLAGGLKGLLDGGKEGEGPGLVEGLVAALGGVGAKPAAPKAPPSAEEIDKLRTLWREDGFPAEQVEQKIREYVAKATAPEKPKGVLDGLMGLFGGEAGEAGPDGKERLSAIDRLIARRPLRYNDDFLPGERPEGFDKTPGDGDRDKLPGWMRRLEERLGEAGSVRRGYGTPYGGETRAKEADGVAVERRAGLDLDALLGGLGGGLGGKTEFSDGVPEPIVLDARQREDIARRRAEAQASAEAGGNDGVKRVSLVIEPGDDGLYGRQEGIDRIIAQLNELGLRASTTEGSRAS